MGWPIRMIKATAVVVSLTTLAPGLALAQEPRVERNGLSVEPNGAFNCARRSAIVTVSAEDPAAYASPNALVSALRAFKDEVLPQCPQLAMVEYRAWAGRYFVGAGNIHGSTGWSWTPMNHTNLEALGSASTMNSRFRGATRAGAATIASPDLNVFYFTWPGTHLWASLNRNNGGMIGQIAYTNMSRFLDGEAFQFVEFDSREITQSPRQGLVAEEDRAP